MQFFLIQYLLVLSGVVDKRFYIVDENMTIIDFEICEIVESNYLGVKRVFVVGFFFAYLFSSLEIL